jgi:hypothetical protein
MNPDSAPMNPDSTPVNHDSSTTDRNSPSGVEPHSGGINMAAGYIPRNDADFLAWMNNFITVLNANLATFGLVTADLTPLTNRRDRLSRCQRSQKDLAQHRRPPVSADGAAHQPPPCRG